MFDKIYTGFLLILLIKLCNCETCSLIEPAQNGRSFPKDFIWGVSSSAYQIEGGWNADDKGESIWDYLTHTYPDKIADKSNGDVAADSYHLYKTDVQILRDLNVHSYRFSIAWTRVLPNGFMNHVSTAGIQYYNNLIDELLRYNITPVVTIYHWDLPQRLQDLGGWTNAEIIPIFTDYAKLLFQSFGDRVKNWITINEAWHICEHSYGVDHMAPAMNYPGIPSYMCAHNVLKAHAEVYHLYDQEFRKTQNGRIGITLDSRWYQALSSSTEDTEAAETALQFYLGWFANPIFSKEGDYPKVMRTLIDKKSKEQGFTRSRLPTFTAAEIKRIRGSSDFFGINNYETKLVTKNKNTMQYRIPSYEDDMDIVLSKDPSWVSYEETWLKAFSKGMYSLLNWVKNTYNNPEIIITENGVNFVSDLNDYARVDYIKAYLANVLDAIEDGVNVTGYFVWSIMDNFEWRSGYIEKYGIYHVDFTDPNRKRTPRDSALMYAQVCKTGKID